ncbi:hypothetical protein GGR97_002855 [Wenyingzhuangia aestuarii]|nr:hypothetical protein [Wenyingzhuangia aestuarii]
MIDKRKSLSDKRTSTPYNLYSFIVFLKKIKSYYEKTKKLI